MNKIRFLAALIVAVAISAFQCEAQSKTLYGINEYGEIYDLTNAMSGGSGVRVGAVPSIFGATFPGNIFTIAWSGNNFVIGTQELTFTTYGQLFSIPLEAMTEKSLVYTTGYYWPGSIAFDASGNAWAAMSSTTSPTPPYSTCCAPQTVGKINLSTGSVSSTINSSDPTAQNIRSLTLKPSGHFLVHSVYTHIGPSGSSITHYLWDLNTATATSLSCTPPNCWYAPDLGPGNGTIVPQTVTVDPTNGYMYAIDGQGALQRFGLNSDNTATNAGTVSWQLLSHHPHVGSFPIVALTFAPPTCDPYPLRNANGTTTMTCL